MTTAELMAFVPAVGFAAVAVVMAWLIGRTGSKKSNAADAAEISPKKDAASINLFRITDPAKDSQFPLEERYMPVMYVNQQVIKPREQATH